MAVDNATPCIPAYTYVIENFSTEVSRQIFVPPPPRYVALDHPFGIKHKLNGKL